MNTKIYGGFFFLWQLILKNISQAFRIFQIKELFFVILRQFCKMVNFIAQQLRNADVIVGPEARGFIVGCPVATELGVGFVPARKPHKLPREVERASYDLEYGSNSLEMHKDAIKPGQRVVLCDDLLATAGTLRASKELIENLGGKLVGAAFYIELPDLKGREKLPDLDIYSLVQYHGA